MNLGTQFHVIMASYQKKQTQEPKQSTEQAASSSQSVAPTRGHQSGMWGWMQGAGDWAAEKYDGITDGIGEWANGVRETTNEIWDVVHSSDFEMEDGIWTLDTDLDEINDLIDIEGLDFDREASDNQVQMEINRNTGEVIIKCANLAMSSLDFEGFKVGSLNLSGVLISVQNASVGAGFLGTLSAKRGGKDNAPQDVSINAAKVSAQRIEIQDPSILEGEPITLDSIELSDFSVLANGSTELFEDAPNKGSFSVSSAVLTGLKTNVNGLESSGSITMQNTSGQFNANEGTAGIRTNSLQGTQLQSGTNQLESSQFQNVEANVRGTQSGGFTTNLSSESAAIQHLDTDKIDANQGSLTGLNAQYNSDTQALTAMINSTSVDGLSGMGVSTDTLSGSGIQIQSDIDDNTHSVSGEQLSSSGVTGDFGTIENVQAQQFVGTQNNDSTSISLGNATAKNVDIQGNSADKIQVSDLIGNRNNAGSSLQLGSAVGTNLEGFGGSISTMNATGVSASGNTDLSQSNFSVQTLSGNDVQHQSTNIGEVSIQNLDGKNSGSQIFASIDSATAHNTNVSGVGNAEMISASGASVSANLTDDFKYNTNFDTLNIQNAKEDTWGTSIQSGRFNNASLSGNDSSVKGQLGSGSMNELALQNGSLESASLTDAQFSMNNGNGSLDVQQMGFQNGAIGDSISIGEGSINNLQIAGDSDQQSGSVQSANINQVEINQPQSTTTVAQAGLTGGHFNHRGDGKGNVGVDNVHGSDISVNVNDLDKKNNNSKEPITNVDLSELLTSGARRLDTADINAQVGMNAGDVGSGFSSIGVDEGTSLNASIQVANNQIQDNSAITTNKPLDSALFTTLNGGYVKDGELMADVRGWFDMSISEGVNKNLDLEGSQLHSISDYAEAIANSPPSENKSSNPIDFSTLQANGSASLSDGVISAGDTNLTLAGASSGKNQMTFGATEQQIAMRFSQLLASSFQLNTTNGQGSSGEVAVDNGSFTVNPQQGTAQGQIDAVSISDINIQN